MTTFGAAIDYEPAPQQPMRFHRREVSSLRCDDSSNFTNDEESSSCDNDISDGNSLDYSTDDDNSIDDDSGDDDSEETPYFRRYVRSLGRARNCFPHTAFIPIGEIVFDTSFMELKTCFSADEDGKEEKGVFNYGFTFAAVNEKEHLSRECSTQSDEEKQCNKALGESVIEGDDDDAMLDDFPSFEEILELLQYDRNEKILADAASKRICHRFYTNISFAVRRIVIFFLSVFNIGGTLQFMNNLHVLQLASCGNDVPGDQKV